MPEYLAPAVYVEEVDTGSKPIEGVSTSTAGMLGVTERGPRDVPILITSNGEFVRWFGGLLDRADFGEHSYLPHAIEGFFTNGGKRVYVVRVLDTRLAASAAARIFDRSIAAPFGNTLLLRAAGEGTGSAANPPPLVVLPDAALGVNDRIRIGTGSAAEYRRIAVAPAVETVLVPLHLPLAHAHGAGTNTVQEIPRALAGAPVDLAVAAAAGASAITVAGATADVNALNGVNILIEIGGQNVGEYRFVTGFSDVTPLAGNRLQARLALDAPLAFSYAAVAGNVAQITVPGPGAPQVDLTPAIASGDSLLFVNGRGGNFTNRTQLVLIDRGGGEREVRRIGELRRVTISSAAAGTYGAGSRVQAVTLGDDARVHLTAAVGGGTALPVNDVSQLRPGQRLLVGPAGGPYERVTVQGITPGAAPAGTINLTAAIAAAKGLNDLVFLERTLLASPRAGATFLALSDRSGLAPGSILSLRSAGGEALVEIAALPNPAPANVWPDPGNVVLTAALADGFDMALTRVTPQNAPTLAAGVQPTSLALAAASGATALFLSDGTGYGGQILRVLTPDGGRFYHRVAALGNIIAPNPAAGDEARLIVLDAALERGHPVGSPVVERQILFDLQALDPGAWGDRLRIAIADEPTGLATSARFRSVTNATRAQLTSMVGIEPGSLLEAYTIADGQTVGPPVKVATVNRGNGEVTFDAANPLTPGQQGAAAGLALRSREFRLSVFLYAPPDPAAPARTEPALPTEVFRNLSMDPRHSRYFQNVIGDIVGAPRLSDHRPDGESWYIRVHDPAQDLPEPQRTQRLEDVRYGPELLVDVLPDGRTRAARQALEGGDDSIGTLGEADYVGVDDVNPERRTGLQCLRNVEEISIIACPGRSSPVIQNALINQCELLRYRFAVLDGQRTPADTIADIQSQRQQYDTKYAALYHPWLLIPDPFPPSPTLVPDYPVPPSGHMVGIYARTDIERGVHKAPANEVVRGIVGLQRILNKEQHDILNPYPVNINVIRDFRLNNRGIRVYGGRVITSDSDWKYVNVRRLLIFIEASIDRGLQWVVFEPNAEPLWARVRRSIANFLTLVWRNGGLEGAKVEEAFFVKCDRTTMTQTDIDSGRLICVVGVAPVKPAEFVIVRIGLWTAHADE